MISVIVDTKTIKKACENYESIYNYIDNLYRTKLEEYRNTKVKRKLFGFNIPWTKTTKYKQSGIDLHLMCTDYGMELARLKVMNEIYGELVSEQISGDVLWSFKLVYEDVIKVTTQYKTYYKLSSCYKIPTLKQLAVGYEEHRFINMWVNRDNPFNEE